MDVLRKMRSKKGLVAAACALLLLLCGLAVFAALSGDGPDGPGASAGAVATQFCTTTGDYSVCTDQADYVPEATVHVTGGGFIPGTSLAMKVTRPDGSTVTGDGSFAAWPTAYDTVIVGDDGTLRYDYVLDGINGEYLVEVLDADGNVLASHTFTDCDCSCRIVIDKVTDPAGHSQSFDFTLTGGSWWSPVNKHFSLTDAAAPYDSGDIQCGSYTATEKTLPAGWNLTSISCNDGNSTVDVGARKVTIKADKDWNKCETVKCTFTNTLRRGTIIVEKQTNPDGAPGSFAFSGNASGSISDNQQIVVNDLLPGTYKSTEAVPAGWDLTSISCDDSNSSGAGATATFKLEAGETVKCTFTNTLRRGTIIVEKQTNPDGAPGSFAFSGNASGSISD
ncbi:MAG: hypothetical protein MUP14_03700, partial [Dehalococcoidia bacterium]|nr:hypothetical protein [Dehalococcoidia bacterium]